jgi:glyoxylase I family protein
VSVDADVRVEVVGLDHVYVSVCDLARSEAFYDPVMRLLDFRKGTLAVGGDAHVHYFNRVMQYTIRPACAGTEHDPYAPGLHHVCLQVTDDAAVDTVARSLRALGVDASEPRRYTEYAPDYYAIFFEDPDGIRLEIVARRHMRRLLVERWEELDVFENPITRKGLV